MTVQVRRHKTAIQRNGLSRPVRLAHESGLIGETGSLFDYGCGRGGDITILRSLGIQCSGWDPVHSPDTLRAESDVVNLGYVINVIENPEERTEALKGAWALARRVLLVSARLDVEAKGSKHREFSDGCLTRRDTFQKFYAQNELREWIDSTLGVESIAAAPGVFFIFRDEQLRQTFASARYRRTSATPRQCLRDALFHEHHDILQPLMEFFAARGRLPHASEVDPRSIDSNFGGIRRAFALVRRVTGDEQWDRIREDRSQDLLVYLALANFAKRPRFSLLPVDLQLDVKELFGTYLRACERADELLFSTGDPSAIDEACRSAPCGKLTHDALYVHTAGVAFLSPVLRVYEGCARNYVGVVDGANIVKLHRSKPKVSYLAYPDFDKVPHPTLKGALVVPLNGFDVKYWDYAGSSNPPILHRKEAFVPSDYPGRDKFTRLTQQEQRCGLFDDSVRIGHIEEWKLVLQNKGFLLRGHRLVRNPSAGDNL